MYKTDAEILKDFKITNIELQDNNSGYITIEFPDGDEHVGVRK